MTKSFEIRRLTANDASLFRTLRLEALKNHPEAFGTAYEEAAARDMGSYAQQLKTSALFGGFDGKALVGVAGFFQHAEVKTQHKGTLYSMYVQPVARGTGLARLLVEAVLDHAREKVEIIQLAVQAQNDTALHLYESCGFKRYGEEPQALKIDGAYFDEVLMYLKF